VILDEVSPMRQLGIAFLVMLFAGCSLTQPEEDPVQIKLRELDGRITRFERVVSNQSLLDLARRVDALESDLRSLHGQIEELQNSIDALRKQQRDLYADLEKRLSAASSGMGAGAGVTPGPEGAAPSMAAGEQAAYTQAFDALKASDYPAAIAGFQQFLSTYSTSELADNAQYWLGEAYYVTRDYEKAADAFRAVGQQWPDSRKAADALLKLGFSQFELKHYAEARTALEEVRRRFPDSGAARLATERLQRMPAGAR
jgi:tol-pal system protein YbgF